MSNIMCSKKHQDLTYSFEIGNCEMMESFSLPRNIPVHTHSTFDEITIVLSGSCLHVIDNERYPLMRGDIFVIKGEEAHGLKKLSNFKLIDIVYKRDFFKNVINELIDIPGFQALFVYEPMFRKMNNFKAKLYLNSNQLNELMPIIKLMKKIQLDKMPGYKIATEYVFKLVVISLCSYYSETDIPRSKELLRISEVINFMEKSFAEKITLNDLADKINLTVPTFRRAFKRVTGCSPIDYLIRLRVEGAAKMMSENNKIKVIDAAMNSGFDNSSYFTRKFKQVMEITPAEYLKLQKIV